MGLEELTEFHAGVHVIRDAITACCSIVRDLASHVIRVCTGDERSVNPDILGHTLAHIL